MPERISSPRRLADDRCGRCLRLEVLQELGESNELCLVATEDEAYTYNNRINWMAIIREQVVRYLLIYSRSLATLTERIAFNRETGRYRGTLVGVGRAAEFFPIPESTQ